MYETPCSHIWAPTALSYFTASISAILLIFTVSGNLLVCIAVFKDPYKRLRTPFMFILVNLAVTDLVVGSITLPLSVAIHSLEGLGNKTNAQGNVMRMSYFISCTASTLNLTAFCVDRFIAVNWPIKYRRFLNTKVCLGIFVVVWILAIGISLLYFAFGFINFLFIFAQVSFFFVVFISVITCGLLRKLQVYSTERRRITSRNNRSTRKSDRRITKLFLLMLIMFFVCYAPAITFMYTLKWCPDCDCKFRHVLRDLQFLFILSNSAVNPFACTIRLKPFRQALGTIFKMSSYPEELPQNRSATILLRHVQRDSTRRISSHNYDPKGLLLRKESESTNGYEHSYADDNKYKGTNGSEHKHSNGKENGHANGVKFQISTIPECSEESENQQVTEQTKENLPSIPEKSE